MYGVWCVVYGVWCMVYGVWCMVYGVWCILYSVWCDVFDVSRAGCKVQGEYFGEVQFLAVPDAVLLPAVLPFGVCGVWRMACGVWCMVYGVWCGVKGVGLRIMDSFRQCQTKTLQNLNPERLWGSTVSSAGRHPPASSALGFRVPVFESRV